MIKRLATALMALFICAGCTTLQSANLTNMSKPASQGRLIEAESSKFTFLGIGFSNEYAFEAREKLYAQCNGTVTGVLSTYETTLYVLFVTFEVRARGFCHEG